MNKHAFTQRLFYINKECHNMFVNNTKTRTYMVHLHINGITTMLYIIPKYVFLKTISMSKTFIFNRISLATICTFSSRPEPKLQHICCLAQQIFRYLAHTILLFTFYKIIFIFAFTCIKSTTYLQNYTQCEYNCSYYYMLFIFGKN